LLVLRAGPSCIRRGRDPPAVAGPRASGMCAGPAPALGVGRGAREGAPPPNLGGGPF